MYSSDNFPLTLLRLPVELLSQIFVLSLHSRYTECAAELSQLLTQIRLVNRLWNAATISTPTLWVRFKIHGFHLIPPGILSIWLERSKNYPLRIEFVLHHPDGRRPYYSKVLSVFSGSVTRWESLVFHTGEESIDLIYRYFPFSSATRLKFLCVNALPGEVSPVLYNLIGTIPSLLSLCIGLSGDKNSVLAYSLVKNLSNLRLCGPKFMSEDTWTMLRHFRGTFLELSSLPHLYDSKPQITFLNLKILCIHVTWADTVRLLSSLHAPGLQILDIYLRRWRGFSHVDRFIEYLSQSEYSLQGLRISDFSSTDGLDRFFQMPAIKAIPLVEIVITGRVLGQALREDRNKVLGWGGVVWVEHWLLGNFVGWHRLFDPPPDLAAYLFAEITPCRCCDRWKTFGFIALEEMKKVNSRISGNRWNVWEKNMSIKRQKLV